MAIVKLCTYSRAFYPYVYGQKIRTVIGAFLIVVDGKIVKRSFCECYVFMIEDPVENEAFAKGLEWIVANMDDLRDINLQVFFCGAARNNIKKLIDDGSYFDTSLEQQREHPHVFPGNSKLLKLFNKVTYHTAARIVINDGEDDDPENTERFDIYAAVSRYFTLLYGDDVNYGHIVYEHEKDDTLVSGDRVQLVGMPELRWRNNCPPSVWT